MPPKQPPTVIMHIIHPYKRQRVVSLGCFWYYAVQLEPTYSVAVLGRVKKDPTSIMDARVVIYVSLLAEMTFSDGYSSLMPW